jgi:hypothetical protein
MFIAEDFKGFLPKIRPKQALKGRPRYNYAQQALIRDAE